jgi:hypothetical protein
MPSCERFGNSSAGEVAMMVDEILAEVEKRMGALDERTRQAVTLALQLAEQHGLPKW